MENKLEERIRRLAQPIWSSAGEQYGTAMDCWLMAENMVLETVSATTKILGAAMGSTVSSSREFWDVPTEVPTRRIRELAHLMWEEAGRQQGATLDFWLAAERHVLTVMRAGMSAQAAEDGSQNELIRELVFGSPAAYLDRVRETAYFLWLSSGEEYGRSVDFWLHAERQVLDTMAATAGFVAPAPSKEVPPARSAKTSPARAKSSQPRKKSAVDRSPKPLH